MISSYITYHAAQKQNSAVTTDTEGDANDREAMTWGANTQAS